MIAEVEWGLHLENQEQRWTKHRSLLEGRLPILETTDDTWRRFARMKARLQLLGQTVADLDLLIAATAAHHYLIAATMNRNDFSRIEGLAWEDWAS